MSARRSPVRRRLWRGFRRSESGASSTEFAIVFPVFMAIFFAAFESGFMMLRNVMLERSVDLAVRDLRLGTPVPPSFAQFKQTICDRTYFVDDCMDVVQVELRPVDMTTWAGLDGAPRCRDVESTIDPFDQTEYSVGTNNEMMIVRVCALFQPMFPSTGIGLGLRYDDTGNYAIVTTSAFVNEPSR